MDTHYINEVLKGNTEAFGFLIKKYQNKVYALSISILKNEDDAKDAVQEGFITAYTLLNNFRNESKFSTWLYRIVVNKSLQFIKREKRKEEILQEYTITNTEKNAFNNAIAQLEHSELKELVKQVFKRITAKEALVLQLYYIDDYNLLEIIEITNFTKANIKVLLYRGRISFYNELKQVNIK